ncbi:YwqI/YxiC family protein [Bacillus sp. 179-C3.3 HS]|uniref:YwqI/YxiC family protein n=1 Tax=Bacillus sp. 179-C3.3 HS TaxID=3232162 RepID=UPI0039A33FF9
MSREIKIDASEVKKTLKSAKQAGAHIHSALPKTFKGKNELSTTKKIEKINQQLNDLSTSYTEILQKQLAQTEQAVNTMMETDKAIATSTKRK